MKQLAAAFIFFTRLPLWRAVRVPDACYQRVVAYWPATGWLVAFVTAAVLYGAAFLLPVPAAVLLALAVRVLLTGALHEDGLSDFLDGFGGGRDREQTLAIMKDSRTGSYGIIGLILYFGMLVALLSSLPVQVACAAILCGDPFCKFVASMTINFLPYARPAQQSKSGVVYAPMRPDEMILSAVFGLLPMLFLIYPPCWFAGLAPLVCFAWLVRLMRRRIGGYTGDCCGAAFLLCEAAFYLALVVLYRYYETGTGTAYLG